MEADMVDATLENAKKRQCDLFEEHLPYELSMLDEATDFLSSTRQVNDDPTTRQDWFRRQSAIEAFWVHARLLIEFFEKKTRTPNLSTDSTKFVPDPSGNHASALDFAPNFKSQISVGNLIKEKVNPQVVHINYQREKDPLKKLGNEIDRVKREIEKDVESFVKDLDDEWKRNKKYKWWQQRKPVYFTWTGLSPQVLSTSSVHVALGPEWGREPDGGE
jgi:hypothetical protein